jgi:hypothetical protein
MENKCNKYCVQVGIADTKKEAKKLSYGHDWKKYRTKTRTFSTSNSLRGQLFKDVDGFYVKTENPILWRDLLMGMSASDNTGPIFYYPSEKYKKKINDIHNNL